MARIAQKDLELVSWGRIDGMEYDVQAHVVFKTPDGVEVTVPTSTPERPGDDESGEPEREARRRAVEMAENHARLRAQVEREDDEG